MTSCYRGGVTRTRLVLVGIVLIAIAIAWAIRFGCDDAFISFVYSRGLVRGDGLTWFGDAIEGYTNFSWVLWIAGGLLVGVDPLVWAWLGSLASLGFVLVGVFRLVRTRAGSETAALCATALVASNYTVLAYGTSGLETMFQTALLTWATLHCEQLRREDPTPRRLAILSVLASLALWTRLDSAVVCAVLAAVTVHRLVRARASRACWLAAIIPAVVLVGGWLAWKLYYYGDLLPNTFHAKVGITGDTLGHGVAFVWTFLWRYALWPLVAVAIAVAMLRKRMDAWMSAAIVIAWFAYVIVVGGDFMEFRFFVPIMPAIAAVIAEGVTAPTGSPRVPNAELRAGVAVAISIAGSWHHASTMPFVAADKTYDSVSALGTFYGLAPGGRWDIAGNALGSVLHGTTATLACNGVGAIPYFSDVYTVDQLGLTDAWVARNGERPPTVFLRPGHQRFATYDYLVSRQVSFVIGTPTIIETGSLAQAPLQQMIPYWMTNFIGPAGQQSIPPVVDLVAAPLMPGRSLLMLYLTPRDDVTAAIQAAGWERRRVTVSKERKAPRPR